MSSTLMVRGRIEVVAAVEDVDLADFLHVDVVGAARIEPPARGEAVEDQVFAEAKDDDVLELEFDDGTRQWLSVAQYRADLAAQNEGAARANRLVVHGLARGGYRTRGLGDWVLKGLRLFRITPEEATATLAVKLLAKTFEDKLAPGPGLYLCDDPKNLGKRIESADDLSADAPILLFIHGTFSSTKGSYSALVEPGRDREWNDLLVRYPNRIIAFEHRTLSQSPIENALELVELLPPKAKLHVVSHSRGGLVGELLCLGDISAEELEKQLGRVFQKHPDRQEDRKALAELGERLRKKQFQIERFVRVACPSRGTTLASERLDLYLSVVLNLIGMIPALAASQIYKFVKATVLELVRRRTSPRELPGLEAQMPDSPLVSLLNRPELKSSADLAVIAGDIEAEGIFKRLLVLGTDLFYLEDHDLVVNTRAMDGGLTRLEGAHYYFERGDEVQHFNYFHNESTRERMYAWLTRLPGDEAGFERLRPRDERVISRSPVRRGVSGPRPVVFLLPGIMGSELAADREPVWLHKLGLACGDFAKLAIDKPNVDATGLMADGYGDLVDYLSGSHEVHPFPFDWRRSIREAGKELGEAVRGALDANPQPVRIVAHSMGGLVARAMIQDYPTVWQDLCQRGGRLLMLGTPNRGSYSILRLLLGYERTLRLLTMLDFKHSKRELLGFIARFPGVLELLPDDRVDFLGPQIWERLRAAKATDWVPPAPKDLADARKGREFTAELPHADRVLYVAGSAPVTPNGIEFSANGDVVFTATTAGDGRVTYESARLPGVKTWYSPVEHGRLASHAPAFPAIVDLLVRGETDRLDVDPPAVARGIPQEITLPEQDSVFYPDEAELVAAALGHQPISRARRERLVLRLLVAHGDLAYASHAVLVGHHEGDSIVSAEARLDSLLEGRLTLRHQLELYPGPRGTAEIVPNPKPDRPAVLVVGLGPVGELTVELLEEAVADATLRYAVKTAEGPDSDGRGQPRRIGISSLLVGAGIGSRLTIQDSIAGVVRGVLTANRRLRKVKARRAVQIDAVEFIELFQDRAINAAHLLRGIAKFVSLQEGERIDSADRVIERRGGRRQVVTLDVASNWWQRIEAKLDDSGRLRFERLTDRARAEQWVEPTDRATVDELVREAVSQRDESEHLAGTLFALLIPNELKPHMAEGRDLVMVLDGHTANYPWELLVDRSRGRADPLAARIGLLRQFETRQFRANPQSAASRAALVIGEPAIDDAPNESTGKTGPDYPPLPGARAEAEEVAKLLRGSGFGVQSCMNADRLTIFNELFARPYRVLHVAGHGEYNPKDPSASGVVLGRGRFLTAAHIDRLGAVPDLVFLNCCHLGRTDDTARPRREDYHLFAASISEQLIRIGVRAVVAAGWAVDDAAAVAFAATLYEELLGGTPFGRAVQLARKATREKYPGVNTWGAYQCYGDPDFRLVLTGAVSAGAPPLRLVSPREYLDEFENIASEEHQADDSRRIVLRRRLDQLLAQISPEWRTQGEILVAIGRACACVGDFPRAIDSYEEALSLEKADVSLRVLEQLANLQIRLATERYRAAAPAKRVRAAGRAFKEAKQGIDRLKLLLQIGETSERLSLLGSAYKRLARLATSTRKQQALRDAADCYRRAHNLAAQQAINPYPMLNWLTFSVLAGDAPADLDKQLQVVVDAAKNRLAVAPSFWDEVIAPDAAVVRHLAAGDLDAHTQPIIDQYQDVRKRGARGDFQSVLEQLRFLIEMLEDEKIGKKHQKNLDALRRILEALGGPGG